MSDTTAWEWAVFENDAETPAGLLNLYPQTA
jgi:hypothetical protein